jgi:hypothetical protein
MGHGTGSATPSISQNSVTTSYAMNTDASGNTTFTQSGTEVTLPVTLSAFTATNTGRLVTLKWTTQTETDNMGFNILRGLSNTDYAQSRCTVLNGDRLISGAIDSTTPVDYNYQDDYRIEYGTTYYYWIEMIDLSGQTTVSSPLAFTPTEESGGEAPDYVAYGLHSNYPNPFNPETTIEFVMDKTGTATLDVFNTRGQLVKQLYNGSVQNGVIKKVVWDGTDHTGKSVSSGMYFYRLRSGSYTEQKQMILMR